MKSFANNKFEMIGAPKQTLLLWKARDSTTWGRRQERPSVNRRKRKGEMGSPWQRPWLGLACPAGSPLIRKENKVDRMHFSARKTYAGSKLNLCMILSKKTHFTQSKALLV